MFNCLLILFDLQCSQIYFNILREKFVELFFLSQLILPSLFSCVIFPKRMQFFLHFSLHFQQKMIAMLHLWRRRRAFPFSPVRYGCTLHFNSRGRYFAHHHHQLVVVTDFFQLQLLIAANWKVRPHFSAFSYLRALDLALEKKKKSKQNLIVSTHSFAYGSN